MNPLKLLRQFVKLIRGGGGTFHIFVACLLGVLIGMIPGFNMTLVIALFLLLVLNANIGLALLGFIVGKALCLPLAPVTFRVGYFIIHGMGLEEMFRAASETPVLALMDLHYYCLVGGLPIALVAGLVMAWILARLVRLARVGIVAAGTRSSIFQWVAGNIVVRILLRILFGKQKGTMADMLQARPPLIRKSGFVFCALLLVAILVVEYFFADDLAKDGLKAGLEGAVGAEVNVQNVELSLLNGRLTVAGLQVTDPDKPTHNAVQLERLSTKVALTDMLARRFVMDRVEITNLRTDAERASPGKVFEEREWPKPEITDDTLSEYFDKGRKILEYLRKVKEYLDEREEARQREAPDREKLERLARRRGYLKLSARSLLAKRPAVTIREIQINGIRLGDGATVYNLQGDEVADKPELNEEPMRFLVGNDAGLVAGLTFNFADPDGTHEVVVKAPNVPVGDAIRLSDNSPVDLTEAKVDLRANGRFSRESLHVPVILDIKNMKARLRPGRSTLGLDPATASKMFERVSQLKLFLTLEGPLEAPRVRIDEKLTLASLREALVEAGQRELASRAGEQLEKLGVKGPIKLPTDLTESTPGSILGGLKDILGPKKDNDKDTPDE